MIEQCIKDFLAYNKISKERVKYDKHLKALPERIIKWLSKIEEKEHQTFLTLLKYFTYFDRHRIVKEFERNFREYIRLEPSYKETIYVPVVSSKGIYNGTNEILSQFKEASGIVCTRIAANPKDYFKRYNTDEYPNVVFIDDIIGSGTTFRDFLEPYLKDFPNKLRNKNIYVISLVVLPKGVEEIKKIGEQNNLKISSICNHKLGQAFMIPEIFASDQEMVKAQSVVKSYEKKIAKRPNDRMGYKKSQALVAFRHNTPNNTLSTFWESEPRQEWYPIFPREIRGKELPPDVGTTLETIQKKKRVKVILSKRISLKRMEFQRDE